MSNEGLQPSFEFVRYLDIVPQVLPDHTLLHKYIHVECILSGKNKTKQKPIKQKSLFSPTFFFLVDKYLKRKRNDQEIHQSVFLFSSLSLFCKISSMNRY